MSEVLSTKTQRCLTFTIKSRPAVQRLGRLTTVSVCSSHRSSALTRPCNSDFKSRESVFTGTYRLVGTASRKAQLTSKNCNEKLSYRRGTVRRAVLVSSRGVSQGMGVRKVSDSKSDLQGHSRALALVPFDRPHTISY